MMYWLIIDGRQSGYSEGATERETADWLIQLGAGRLEPGWGRVDHAGDRRA